MNNFSHKKIGIWGFGVVGTSALTYFDQYNLARIEILNNKPISLPKTNNICFATLQDPTTIKTFLDTNDYILVSPGIPLHDYQDYHHKFISELDLFHHHNKIPTIAITGSLGKTSITHLLTNILQKSSVHAVAAGNIGYAMLSLITPTPNESNKKIDKVVLELSSFQLQQAQLFAPDLAIITNVYDNHLDHHASMQEYLNAKCNIFSKQFSHQIALLPCNLLPDITALHPIKENWAFFSPTKPTADEFKLLAKNTVYYLDNKIIYKKIGNVTTVIFNISQLPPITFDTNLLIIIAALDLQKISLAPINQIIEQLDIPNHRLQKIASFHGSDFYNDSKSTVWQATLQAVNCMDNKPIKLFLGGLSKGADRTPLIQALQSKNIEIYAFGKEASILGQICTTLNIAHQAHATLQESFAACMLSTTKPSNILFSPAGSSYDLFDNYMQRGQCFAKLVDDYTSKK